MKPQPLNINAVTCIYGRTQSGKSTLARTLVAGAKPRQILKVDPSASEGETDLRDVRDALQSGQKGVCFRGQIADEQLGAVIMAAMLSTKAKPIFVIADEASLYLNKDSNALRRIMFQGRHEGLGLIVIGHRPSALSPIVRSQAAVSYWMGLSDHVDIDVAAKSIGTEAAKALLTYKAGDFIAHPPPMSTKGAKK